MNGKRPMPPVDGDLLESAEYYDRSINWDARLARELPVLIEVFGPPAPEPDRPATEGAARGGIIDAGCGSGRQVIAMAQRGYRVVGVDLAEEMLALARRLAREASCEAEFVSASYDAMPEALGGGFDGVYCLGNALAAAGSKDAAEAAVHAFARCLRPGGRLFVQILNFAPMRKESPCVRGPRIANVGGREYVSVRHFQFFEDRAEVTNVTLWQDDGWKQRARTGRLYPIGREEMHAWCSEAGLRVDAEWGGYDRAAFDIDASIDLIIAATREPPVRATGRRET